MSKISEKSAMSKNSIQAALVTKTLLSSSAQALGDPASLTLASFFDLCSLIDACVILDHMEVIESTDTLAAIPPISDLFLEGIISEYRPTLSRSDLRRVMLRLPSQLGDHLPASWIPGYENPRLSTDDNRANSIVNTAGAPQGVDFSADLDYLLHQLQQIVEYPSIKNALGQRMWRSLGYLVVAAANGLDYFPDYDRVPFTAAFIRGMYRSLPMQLYQRISDAIGQRIDEEGLISEWTTHVTLAIPAASAIVLHRADSLSEIPQQILEVRAEFSDYRNHFANFKARLQQAETMDDRAKLSRTYAALLKEASGARSEIVSVGEVLNFTEAALRAGAAPQLPTSYGASLIAQPAEWLRRWWMRRPLAILFRLDGKLPRASEYRQLISKFWGDAINESLLDELARHPGDVAQVMRFF